MQVKAFNSESTGSDPWSASGSVTTASPGVPAAPPRPSVKATSGSRTSLDVSWRAPSDDGGAAITDYDVQYREAGTSSWTNHAHTGTARTATIGSLADGTRYEVQVRAENTHGDGDWSDSGFGTAGRISFTSPDAFEVKEHHTGEVGTVRARDGDTVLNRCRQSDTYRLTGGADRNRFTLTCFGGLFFREFVPDHENPRDANGDNVYEITVTAKGGTGANAETAQQAIRVTVVDVDRPDAPSGLRVTRRNTGYLAVEWDAPDHGGLAVDRYGVRYRKRGQSRWEHDEQYNAPAPAPPEFGITGLEGATTYEIQARARNPEGWGPWSATFEAATDDKPSAPARPTIGAVTETGFEVRWSAPAAGASPIEEYQVRWGETDPGGDYEVKSVGSDVRSTSIGGLQAGTRYEVSVRARNGSGWGHWSLPAEATPGADGEPISGTSTSPLAGFTLVDGDDGSDIRALREGATLAAGLGRLEIRADLAAGESVGSVRFELRGAKTASRTENHAPYELFGGQGGEEFGAGSYSVTATPYTESGLGGRARPARTVSFTVRGTSQHTGALPQLTVSDAGAIEGTELAFAVTLDPAAEGEVTVGR